ncbi:MAG: multidrug transporter [Micromonosporaceae bacterium]|nr:multidrug transporter [Micromonosporaceae bacterium]
MLALPLVLALTLGLAGPVVAAPAAPAAPPSAVSLPAAPAVAAADLETERRSRPVAPGVTLTSFEELSTQGWVRGDALAADLTKGSRVDYLSPGAVAQAEPISTQAKRERAVAAVNGDFFDINNSNAPLGPAVDDGELVKSPSRTWSDFHTVAGIDAAGAGRILQLYFDGSVALPNGETALHRLNSPEIPVDGIGAYTSLWGTYSRAKVVADAERVTEVVIIDGKVAEVRQEAGEGAIPADATVLVGREGGADTLRALQVGDPARVSYRPRTSDGSTLTTAIGGRDVLVIDGKAQTFANQDVHPRTAVGFSEDGRKMYLLTVDGRLDGLRGLSLDRLAVMMRELGAHSALNLDGGGSSTLVARQPGSDEPVVENQPADGHERSVPNGLGIFAPEGSGELHGYWVQTEIDRLAAPTASPRPGGRPDRVFPGLTRRLDANGHDETYGPAAGDPTWRAAPISRGSVSADGVFTAGSPGVARVTATRGEARGEIELHVLGPLSRVAATTERVSLADPDAVAGFGVVGYDAAGFSAPIEPADIRLEYDRTLLDITPGDNGALDVRARKASGSALVTVKVGAASTVIPVTVGLVDRMAADLGDAGQWTFTQARAAGSVAPATGHDGGPALKMSYDFTRSTATRAAYANPPAPVQVPGQPQAFTMWLHGNGTGEWPSLHLTEANGQSTILRGPFVTWHGWRKIELAVPAGVEYPLSIRRFYVAEVRGDTQYHSEVIIDDIVAKTPPSVDLPEPPRVKAPAVVTDGTVDGAPWRFAVMSDAQFVARNPDSDLVVQARRTMREIKAARPDFVLINGDFVDEAAPEDFALARRLITEEWGDDVHWQYIPGNHEIMGGPPDDPIRNFTDEFGAVNRVFDHKGTRFVTLNSATGVLGLDQLRMLKSALDGAERDPDIGSVALLWHHPPRDPTPQQGSLLSDRREAALVEQWLADLRLSSGKGAMMINAHVGVFHAAHVDGVPYVINGNSGKAPAAAPRDGGFTGWTMVGVDPVTEREAEWVRSHPYTPTGLWARMELRAHVDALSVTAPSDLAVGETATVRATANQRGREVPVVYPVSADWSGSDNLHIGDAEDAKARHIAVFDPATGTLRALRAGTVTIKVTVNGTTSKATVTLTA